MKEFFEWGKRILGVGQPQPGQPPAEQPQADEEQSRASGGTAQPGTEKGQTTGSSEPNSQQAGHEKNPARRKGSETTKRWNPEQGCLEVKTERVLELRSLSTVLIKLAKGQIRIEGTDKVQQPELTITERIYAGSKSEATRFYKENGSGVNVEVDSDTLSVTEKSSSGVVSGRYGNIQVGNVSGSGINIGGPGNIQVGNVSSSGINIGGPGNIQVGNVSSSGINIGGPGNIQVGNVSGSGINIGGPGNIQVGNVSSSGINIGGPGNIQVGNVSGSGINIGGPGNIQVGNVSGSGITIGGRQTESSQLAPRRKMQVVLRVPVAKNVEGKKPNYQLEVKAGDVKVENTSGGVCNIVVNAGNVHIERYKGEKIELSNQSANVEIYESEGKFSIGAISGNIMIGNSTGSFRISAVSGNITLTNVTFTQDNKISATSGNIQAEVANKRLKVYAETLSGKITTSGSFVVTKDNRPQRGAGGNVDRSVTITGNVDGSVIITGIGGNVYFGTNVFSDGSAGGSIEGRFGEPGDQNNLLTLTTTSGNITIQQAPQIKQ